MTIVIGLLALDVLVVLHELGHLAAAKILGVTVEAFSVGMGPVLLHKKIGGIDWRISLLPVGGYCAMKGEKDYQASLEADLPYIQAEADSFYGASPLRRLAIAFAGPFVNFIFAVLAAAAVAMAGFSYYSFPPQVRLATSENGASFSAAREAGLLDGDTVLEIDGREIENFSDIQEAVAQHPKKELKFVIMRGGKRLEIPVVPELDKESATGKIGITVFNRDAEPVLYHTKRLSFLPALAKGAKDTAGTVALIFTGFKIMFSGVDISKTVAGPVQVAAMLGQTVKSGPVYALNLMSLISVSLFVMNLLPIPVLDGGLCLFALLEAASRRRMRPKVLYVIQTAGLALVIMLAAFSFGVDALHFIRN